MALSSMLIQQLLIIPKSINLITFLLIAFNLIKKYKKTPEEQKYVLNRLFIFGFLSWSLYMLFDILLYPLASLSFMNQGIQQMDLIAYYPEQYPSLVIANILRDIGLAAAFALAYSYFFSALIVMKGELWVNEKVLKKPLLPLVFLILTIYLIANDTIGVEIINGDIIVEAVWNGAAGFSILFSIIIYFIASLLLAMVILKMDYCERDLKIQFTKISIGMILMSIGAIYWFIFGYIRTIFQIDLVIVFIWYVFGHFIWSISPILIYQGLRKMWKRECKQQPPTTPSSE